MLQLFADHRTVVCPRIGRGALLKSSGRQCQLQPVSRTPIDGMQAKLAARFIELQSLAQHREGDAP